MEEITKIVNEMRQNLNVNDASELDDDAFKDSLNQLLQHAVPTSKAAQRLLKKPNLAVFQITPALSDFLNAKPKESQNDNIPQVPDYDDSGNARFNFDSALENFQDENQSIRQVMEFVSSFLAGSLLEDWAELILKKKYGELKKNASNIRRDALKLGMEAFGYVCKQMNMAALEESEKEVLDLFRLLVDENASTFYKVVKQLEIKGIQLAEPSEKVKQLLAKRIQVADDVQQAMQIVQKGNDVSPNRQQQKFQVDPKKGFVYGKMKRGDSPPPTGVIDFSKIYSKKGSKETAKSRELKEKALQEMLAKEKEAQGKLEAEKTANSEEKKPEVIQTPQPNTTQLNQTPQPSEEPKKGGFQVDPKKGFRYGRLKEDSPPPSGMIDFAKIYEKRGSRETEKSRALKQKALILALERDSAGANQNNKEKTPEQSKNTLNLPDKFANSNGDNIKPSSGAHSPRHRNDANRNDFGSREEVKESRFKTNTNEDSQISYNNQQRNIQREMLKRGLDVKTDKKAGKDREGESSATVDVKRKSTMDEDHLKKVGERSEKRNMTFSPPPSKAGVSNPAAAKNDAKGLKEIEIKAKKDPDSDTPAFGNSIIKGQSLEEQKAIGNKDLKVIKEETVDKTNAWRFTKLVHSERRPGADLESRIKIIKKDDGPGLYYQGWANQKKPKGDYPFDNGLKCTIF